MNTLPGFFPPESPNLDERFEAFADGTVELVLLDNEPAGTSTNGLSVRLYNDFGLQQVLVASAAQLADCLLVLDVPGGLKQVKFILRPSQLTLAPGTYTLRLLLNGQTLLTRSLVVPPRP